MRGHRTSILFLIDKLQPAGTQKHLLDLVSSLSKDRFTPIIVCLEAQGDWYGKCNELGITAFSMNLKKIHSLRFIPTFLKLIWITVKHRVKIIHCYLPMANVMGGLLKLVLFKKKLITTRRDMGISSSQRMKAIETNFCNVISDSIIVNSNAIKNNMTTHLDKVDVIYNGVTFSSVDEKENETRKKYSIPAGETLAAIIGDMNTPVKGHSILFEAVEKKTFPGKILVVGEGALRYSYMDEVSKKNLSDIFIFTGSVNDTQIIMRDIDFLIVPSLSEGMPNVILESLFCGTPVIASNVGGIPEIFTHNESGYLIESHNPQALSEAIDLFCADKNFRLRLGEMGRRIVLEKFGFETMIANYEKKYHHLIAGEHSCESV